MPTTRCAPPSGQWSMPLGPARRSNASPSSSVHASPTAAWCTSIWRRPTPPATAPPPPLSLPPWPAAPCSTCWPSPPTTSAAPTWSASSVAPERPVGAAASPRPLNGSVSPAGRASLPGAISGATGSSSWPSSSTAGPPASRPSVPTPSTRRGPSVAARRWRRCSGGPDGCATWPPSSSRSSMRSRTPRRHRSRGRSGCGGCAASAPGCSETKPNGPNGPPTNGGPQIGGGGRSHGRPPRAAPVTPPPLDVFRRTLELELDADLGRVGRFGEGVLVGPLSFAVGLDLDLVVILGMAEGTLPAAVHDDSLLPDGKRRAAGGELPLRRERVGREQRRVLAALAAADHPLLCAPRGDLRASSERVPSRWLAELTGDARGPDGATATHTDVGAGARVEHVPSFAHAVTHVAFPATEQEYRLRAGPDHDPVVEAGSRVIRARRSRAFPRFDGNLAGLAVPSPLDEVVSSTRLESWASCPFAYFVGHLLQVEPTEDPARQLTISAWDRGSLVHEILQSFVDDVLARPAGRQPEPDQSWSPGDHDRMRELAERHCDAYEARGLTGRPVFWRHERSQILALADRFLTEDDAYRRAIRSRPVAAELRFGYDDGAGTGAVALALPDGRQLRFRGAADRVDLGDDGTIRVADYKTGKADDFRRLGPDNPDERGTKLQLPVYGLAARQFVGQAEAPVEAHYWFVSDREGFKRIGYAVDDQVLARVGEHLTTIVDGIERGAFPARPDASSTPWVTCPYCDPDGLGVAELRRDWERKRHDPAIAAYAEMAEPEAI